MALHNIIIYICNAYVAQICNERSSVTIKFVYIRVFHTDLITKKIQNINTWNILW